MSRELLAGEQWAEQAVQNQLAEEAVARQKQQIEGEQYAEQAARRQAAEGQRQADRSAIAETDTSPTVVVGGGEDPEAQRAEEEQIRAKIRQRERERQAEPVQQVDTRPPSELPQEEQAQLREQAMEADTPSTRLYEAARKLRDAEGEFAGIEPEQRRQLEQRASEAIDRAVEQGAGPSDAAKAGLKVLEQVQRAEPERDGKPQPAQEQPSDAEAPDVEPTQEDVLKGQQAEGPTVEAPPTPEMDTLEEAEQRREAPQPAQEAPSEEEAPDVEQRPPVARTRAEMAGTPREGLDRTPPWEMEEGEGAEEADQTLQALQKLRQQKARQVKGEMEEAGEETRPYADPEDLSPESTARQMQELLVRMIAPPATMEQEMQLRRSVIPEERTEVTKEELQDVIDSEIDETPKGFAEVVGEAVKNPTKVVPFIAAAPEAARALEVYQASESLAKGEETLRDLAVLKEYFEAQQRDRTWAGTTAEILTEMPAFVGEFAATGGLYTAGRKGAVKGAKKLTKKAINRRLRDLVSRRVAAGTRRAAGALAGSVARTPGFSARVVDSTIRNMNPEAVGLSEDESGQLEGVITAEGDDFAPALAKGYGTWLIEAATEVSGEGAQRIGRSLVQKLGQEGKLQGLKAAIAGKVLGENRVAGVSDFLDRVRSRAGWHGVATEIGEEELSKLLHFATGIEDRYEVTSPAEFGAMAAAFSVMPAGRAIIERGAKANARRKGRKILTDAGYSEEEAEEMVDAIVEHKTEQAQKTDQEIAQETIQKEREALGRIQQRSRDAAEERAGLADEVNRPEDIQAAERAIAEGETGKPLQGMFFRGEREKDKDVERGIFLTPDPKEAQEYAQEGGGQVERYQVNSQNPLYINANDPDPAMVARRLEELGHDAPEFTGRMTAENTDRIIATAARRAGYDAIVYSEIGQVPREEIPGHEIQVLDAEVLSRPGEPPTQETPDEVRTAPQEEGIEPEPTAEGPEQAPERAEPGGQAPAEEQPAVGTQGAEGVSPGAQRAVQGALQSLQRSKDRIQQVARARGWNSAEVERAIQETSDDVSRAHATLRTFRDKAPQNDVDPDRALAELGGVPAGLSEQEWQSLQSIAEQEGDPSQHPIATDFRDVGETEPGQRAAREEPLPSEEEAAPTSPREQREEELRGLSKKQFLGAYRSTVPQNRRLRGYTKYDTTETVVNQNQLIGQILDEEGYEAPEARPPTAPPQTRESLEQQIRDEATEGRTWDQIMGAVEARAPDTVRTRDDRRQYRAQVGRAMQRMREEGELDVPSPTEEQAAAEQERAEEEAREDLPQPDVQGVSAIRPTRATARGSDIDLETTQRQRDNPNEPAGRLTLRDLGDNDYGIVGVDVAKGQQGEGHGTKLYDAAIDFVRQQGGRLTSDSSMTQGAVRRWQALKRQSRDRDYTVQEREQWTDRGGGRQATDAQGNLVHEPLFTIDFRERRAEQPQAQRQAERREPTSVSMQTARADADENITSGVTLRDFAQRANKAAQNVEARALPGDANAKYISDVYEQMRSEGTLPKGMGREEFDIRLVQANNEEGLPVELSRADLTEAFNRQKAEQSLIRDRGSEKHLIRAQEEARGQEEPPEPEGAAARRGDREQPQAAAAEPVPVDKYGRPTQDEGGNPIDYGTLATREHGPTPVTELNPQQEQDARTILNAYQSWQAEVAKEWFKGNPSRWLTPSSAKARTQSTALDVESLDAIEQAFQTVGEEIPTGLPDMRVKSDPRNRDVVMRKVREAQRIAKEKQPAGGRPAGALTPLTSPSRTAFPQVAKTTPKRLVALSKQGGRREARYESSGVLIEEGGNRAVVTDGQSLHVAEGENFGDEGLWDVTKAGKLTAPSADASFPKYREIFEGSPKQTKANVVGTEQISDLFSRLNRILPIAQDHYLNTVTVAKNPDGSIGFAAHTSDTGYANVNVQEGATDLGAVDAKRLREALRLHRQLGEDTVTVWWEKYNKPIRIKGREGNAHSLVMPVKGEEGGEATAVAQEVPLAREDVEGQQTIGEQTEQGPVTAENASNLRNTKRSTDKGGPTNVQQASVALNLPESTLTEAAQRGENIESRADLIGYLSQLLDAPVRIGRFRQRAFGIYKRRENVIRLKTADDLPTALHEFGHHLDQMLGLGAQASNTSQVGQSADAEIIRLGEATSRQDASEDTKRAEGVAEFFRLYMGAPQRAQNEAPSYYRLFENALSQAELYEGVNKVRSRVATHLQATAEQRVQAQILRNQRVPSTHFAKRLWNRAYTNWFDDLHFLRIAVEDINGGQAPKDTTENAYQLARLARGSAGILYDWVKGGGIRLPGGTKLGPSLQEAIRPISDQMERFETYATARRAQELHQRNINPGISREDANATVNAIENTDRADDFQQAFDNLQRFNDGVVDYMMQRGLLTNEAARVMREMNRNYVPFQRVFTAEDTVGEQTSGGAPGYGNQRAPVKSIRGSGRRIHPPLRSLISNAYAAIDAAEKNEAMRTLTGQAEAQMSEEGVQRAGRWVERVPPNVVRQSMSVGEASEKIRNVLVNDYGMDPEVLPDDFGAAANEIISTFRADQGTIQNENTIRVMKDGKPVFYRLEPNLYEAVQNIGVQESGVLGTLLGAPARLLRIGATGANPEFLMVNLMRDTAVASIQSSGGAAKLPSSLKEVLGQGDAYWDFQRGGGAFGSVNATDIRATDSLVHDISHPVGLAKAQAVAMHPIERMRALSEAIENVNRLTVWRNEYERAINENAPSQEAVRRASMEARESTLDFQRAGRYGRAINRYIPFFNAGLQGSDKMVRTLYRNPGKTSVGIMMFSIGPSIASFLTWMDDPDEYGELPAWSRDYYFHYRIPETIRDGAGIRSKWLRVPKPIGWGLFGSTLERMLLDWSTKDRDAYREYGDSLRRNFADPLGVGEANFIPQAIKPLTEVMYNYDMFRDRPIVSPWEDSVEPWLQYEDYTSDTMKYLGKKFNTSPKKLEHLWYGYTAGLGRMALNGFDATVDLVSEGRFQVPYSEARYPIIRRFLADRPGQSAVSVSRMYEIIEGAEGARDSARRLLERYQSSQTDQRWQEFWNYYRNHRSDLALAGITSPRWLPKGARQSGEAPNNIAYDIRQKLSGTHDKIDRIQQKKRIRPQDRQKLDGHLEELVAQARRGLEIYDRMNQNESKDKEVENQEKRWKKIFTPKQP